MRYETLMTVLKFAEREVCCQIRGAFVYDMDRSRKGPLVKSIEDAISEGFVEQDPLGRIVLTEMGRQRLNPVDRSVRIVTMVPSGQEAAFRAMVKDFFRDADHRHPE